VIDINDPNTKLPEAIFFTDLAVTKVLPIFYIFADSYTEMTKGEAGTKWGAERADTIFGATEPTTAKEIIDKKFIDLLWNTPDKDDKLLPMIEKIPGCPLE
jgi:hypothetical protein